MATPDVEKLIGQLRHGNSDIRREAVEALVRLGSPAVSALCVALKDEYWVVRIGAAEALGNINDAASIPTLCGLLKDKHSWVRGKAVEVLVKLGSPALPALCGLLTDEDWDVRYRVATTLGRIGNASAVPALCGLLTDEDRDVRREASRALLKIDPLSVPALRELLKDEDRDVRYRAAEGLVKIGSPAVPILCEALKDENHDVRREVAEALGAIGDASAVPVLCGLLKDEDSDVREKAASALENLGDAMTLPRKILMTSSLTPPQRVQALESLRGELFRWDNGERLRYRFPKTRTLCQRVEKETDEAVRKGAREVLQWLESEPQTLLRPSQQEEAQEREELLRGAEFSPTEDAAETLLRGSEPLTTDKPLTLWERLRQSVSRAS